MSVRYSVVVPVYNEEAVAQECYVRLTKVMASLRDAYELIFVDDGSLRKTECESSHCGGNGSADVSW